MKINKTVLFISFFVLMSCPSESPMWERTYQIRNDSGFDTVIRFYDIFNNEIFQDIIVLDNQFFRGDTIEGSNFDALNDTESIRPGQSYASFRLIIVYENERKMEYTRIDSDDDDIPDSFSGPINGNLLRSGNYTNIGNNIFEFVLTDEDYNNAIPCNGNCLD
ncbi:hypothetical protein [uncultured Winogradskyella sp.]|uniref:hypothetical protein n=1 Tax=uncultured Winogradskyella sp. TaxID=395353 RepID=UPI00261096ED|nr:hypothetical protein [uncultured Winogradskyella sp.]